MGITLFLTSGRFGSSAILIVPREYKNSIYAECIVSCLVVPYRTARIREPISRFHPRPPWEFVGATWISEECRVTQTCAVAILREYTLRDKEAVSKYEAVENISIDIAAFAPTFLTVQ